MTAPTIHEFARAIDDLVSQAATLGLSVLEIRAGDLHRQVGGQQHPSDRMPTCCNAMRQRMGPEDEIVTAPPKGNGANLRIRYHVRNRTRLPIGGASQRHRTSDNTTELPPCPSELPADIAEKVRELGRAWANSAHCPQIEPRVVQGWVTLLTRWVTETSLPLLVRKGSLVGGAEFEHPTGRKVVATDNAPAQWSCNLALRGIVPELTDIRNAFDNDAIPMSFAHKALEQKHRKYHCTLGRYNINKAGWKLCHIQPVGLKSRQPISELEIAKLQQAFLNLLSPSNYFLLPKQWGGLGEADDFIEGFLSGSAG